MTEKGKGKQEGDKEKGREADMKILEGAGGAHYYK